ncbi:MAG: hypothetical protein MHM6MM_008180 [Cercozoa sp. M6MM]
MGELGTGDDHVDLHNESESDAASRRAKLGLSRNIKRPRRTRFVGEDLECVVGYCERILRDWQMTF